MKMRIELSKSEVVEAIELYLLVKRSMLLDKYRFNTTAEYRRVLFERSLSSKFTGFTAEVSTVDRKFEVVEK